MVRRRSHGKHRGPKKGVVILYLSAFVGRIRSLSNTESCRQIPKTTSSSMATPNKSCPNRGDVLDMLPNGREENIDKYAFVHSSIQEVLTMKPSTNSADFFNVSGSPKTETENPILVDNERCTIKWETLETYLKHEDTASKANNTQETLSMEQLVLIASHCEHALIRESQVLNSLLPPPILGLLQIIPKKHKEKRKNETKGEYYLIATLLALNMVENSIRHLLRKENGKAPLLKDMINIMARRKGNDALPGSLLLLLRTLLLPNGGINLRNLLWHGFLPTIHPRWFALSVVLTLSLDELAGSSSFQVNSSGNTVQTILAMRQHKELVTILDDGRTILSNREKMASFERMAIQSNIIPKSHIELFKVSLKFVNSPIIFASVVSPFIEHVVRLMWCEENEQNKCIAEPGSYYVTLDGHGQRNKHEVVIMPFYINPEEVDSRGAENKLVYRLGGSRMAFLMDMFAAPSTAPNIRASVAHGSFNKYLLEELASIEEKKDHMRRNVDELSDITNALISILNTLCDDNSYAVNSYRPIFSYSATLLAELDTMVIEMKEFYKFVSDGHYLKYSSAISQSEMQEKITHDIANMAPEFGKILGMQERIRKGFFAKNSKFTDEDFFHEHNNNLIASECGATKLLLSEISQAASSSLQNLNDGISVLQDGKIQLSSRRRKQVYRICASAKLTFDFYSFAAYCALLHVKRRQDNVKESQHTLIGRTFTDDELFIAVKRSRMTISTFTTTKSFDRALSALAQYTAGKAVKAIRKSVQEPSIERSECIQ